MKKVVTIVGARPQFVKAAVISRAFEAHSDIEEIIIHTGQHFDKNMSDIFFTEMNIPLPKYQLDINGGTHGKMTGKMLEDIEAVLIKENPDLVLVYGDTNSTLAGALAASKLHIKVAHIEAGLRSFNMRMPEEVNRILTDKISNFLFCPTETAVNNLSNEGVEHSFSEVVKTGDVMYDAALYYSKSAPDRSSIIKDQNLNEPFILATVHRQENTDDEGRLRSIVSSLNKIHASTKVIVPLHPRTKNKIADLGIDTEFITIPPIGYFDIIQLLSHCSLVMTDSGGMQKEAYFFGKYCITLRDQTEWVELIENNVNSLVGADSSKIISAYQENMGKEIDTSTQLYGTGNSGELIVQKIKDSFNQQ